MSGISRDEWLAALKDATAAPLPETDAVTLQEFAAMLGVERSAAERRMKALVALGKAIHTRKQIRRTDGAIITAPAYRLVKEDKPEKRPLCVRMTRRRAGK